MYEKDNYPPIEDNMDMNHNMGMNPYPWVNPYMGMYMQSMAHMYPYMYPWMMPINYPMPEENMMSNMAMYPMMNISSMPMMPRGSLAQGMNTQPLSMNEGIDENYMNYMINMNKYMSYLYEAEAYRFKAMEYINKIEK